MRPPMGVSDCGVLTWFWLGISSSVCAPISLGVVYSRHIGRIVFYHVHCRDYYPISWRVKGSPVPCEALSNCRRCCRHIQGRRKRDLMLHSNSHAPSIERDMQQGVRSDTNFHPIFKPSRCKLAELQYKQMLVPDASQTSTPER